MGSNPESANNLFVTFDLFMKLSKPKYPALKENKIVNNFWI